MQEAHLGEVADGCYLGVEEDWTKFGQAATDNLTNVEVQSFYGKLKEDVLKNQLSIVDAKKVMNMAVIRRR
jgi:hypothetical protein